MNAPCLPVMLSDTNRPIRLRFGCQTDLAPDLMLPQHVSGSETMFGGLVPRTHRQLHLPGVVGHLS